MSSKELMRLLESKGWILARVKGSHHSFKKTGKNYLITVPHPEKDISKGTLHSILKVLD